jgi:predicted metal-dependent hydrolase
VENIEINGRPFCVRFLSSRNRNASARLKDHEITISIPSRWPSKDRDRVAKSLLSRAVKSIKNGRWIPEHGKKMRFHHGQIVSAMGKEFLISIKEGRRFMGKNHDGHIQISAPVNNVREDRVAALVRREITRSLLPDVEARVHLFNQEHFGARVRKVAVRDTKSRWGSCSIDGSICLNFRLLFMPQEILDYVIVHELSHTRYRGHGPRFWDLVARIIPDHKEKRKWLRMKGWEYPKSEPGALVGKDPGDEEKAVITADAQGQIIEFIHEPDEAEY